MMLPQHGIDPWSCLSFDIACVSFVERYEQMAQATIEVPMTEAEKKQKAMKRVPAYSLEDLMRVLRLPYEESREQLMLLNPMVIEKAEDILSGNADWLYPE